MIEATACTEYIYAPILVTLRVTNKDDMAALCHLAVQELTDGRNDGTVYIPVDPLHAEAIKSMLKNLHKTLCRV